MNNSKANQSYSLKINELKNLFYCFKFSLDESIKKILNYRNSYFLIDLIN